MAYEWKNDPKNPDAKPLYNDSILKFWNWFDNVWTCSDWMAWHKSLKTKYGLTTANYKFVDEWDNMATGSSAIDCRTFNTTFRDYMHQNGLLDALYKGLGVIAKPIGAAGDVVTGVGDAVSGIGTGVGSAGKVLKTLIPVVLIIVIVFVFLHFYKKSKSK